MTARAGVAEFTKVGEVLAKVVTPVTMTEEQLQAIRAEARQMVEGLDQVRVVDAATYQRADNGRVIIKRAKDFIAGKFAKPKADADAVHKFVIKQEKTELADLLTLDARFDTEMRTWRTVEAERRRKAELEAAETLRQQQQAAALEEADALHSAGEVEMAEQVMEQAIDAQLPTVSLPDYVPETSTSFRENWQFCYLGASPGQAWKDLTEAQRDHVMQLLPREYCVPDESKLLKIAKAMKGGFKGPWAKAYDKGSSQVRG